MGRLVKGSRISRKRFGSGAASSHGTKASRASCNIPGPGGAIKTCPSTRWGCRYAIYRPNLPDILKPTMIEPLRANRVGDSEHVPRKTVVRVAECGVVRAAMAAIARGNAAQVGKVQARGEQINSLARETMS